MLICKYGDRYALKLATKTKYGRIVYNTHGYYPSYDDAVRAYEDYILIQECRRV